MQVKLTPRMEKIANLVKYNNTAADIGTDHGYIAIYLVQNSISPFVIAGDVNLKPLESAKKNIEAAGLVDKIETRLGSGLTILKPKEASSIIIAGMGGLLISEIIQHSLDVAMAAEMLILQPMQAQEELRRYIVEAGFRIVKDILVKEDHRIYEIICVQKGEQRVTKEIFFDIGFYIEENPRELAKEFLEGKINILKNIIDDISKVKAEATKDKLKQCQEKLNSLEEVMLWLKE